MPKHDDYRPNYRKLYPGIEKRPDILAVLQKSDRKMEYLEVDLKRERFIQDQEAERIRFLPSCEDSYHRLMEEEHMQFAVDEPTPEATVILREDIRLLRLALLQLDDAETTLIQALYFDGLTERQLAQRMGVPPMTIHDRKVRILRKLKTFFEL